jgi:hypothetical protein
VPRRHRGALPGVRDHGHGPDPIAAGRRVVGARDAAGGRAERAGHRRERPIRAAHRWRRCHVPARGEPGQHHARPPARRAVHHAAQYRTWFAAMGWLGIRVVGSTPSTRRPSTRNWPAQPEQPGPAALPDAGRLPARRVVHREAEPLRPGRHRRVPGEIEDASARSGRPVPAPPGRASGAGTPTSRRGWPAGSSASSWTRTPASIRPPQRRRPPVSGRYFRSTPAPPRPSAGCAARMIELARSTWPGRPQPSRSAFRPNWPTTRPLRHPGPRKPHGPGGSAANWTPDHVRPHRGSGRPANVYASYHAYPYYPDFPAARAGASLVLITTTRSYSLKLHPYPFHLYYPLTLPTFSLRPPFSYFFPFLPSRSMRIDASYLH